MTARITPERLNELRTLREPTGLPSAQSNMLRIRAIGELLDALEATQRDLDAARAAIVTEVRELRMRLIAMEAEWSVAREALEEIVDDPNATRGVARAALAKIQGKP